MIKYFKKRTTSRNRILEWDALRGIAAVFVMVHHYTERYESIYGHIGHYYYESLRGGQVGVCIFLMLSGYFMMVSLSKCNRLSEFIVKRSVRLYPAYIVAVLLTSIFVWVFGLPGRACSLLDTFINFTMIQSFMGVKHVDGAYWTLVVELRYYFLFSFIFFFIARRKSDKSIYFAIAWLIAAALLQLLRNHTENIVVKAFSYLLIVEWCHVFIAGMMMSLMYKGILSNQILHRVVLACMVYSFYSKTLPESIIFICVIVVFYMVVYGKLGFLCNRFLVFLGGISYSLYLLHQNIGFIIIRGMESIGLTNEFFLVIPMTIIILMATMVTYFVEHPIQAKLNQLVKKLQ